MNSTRRYFFKQVGVAGATLAAAGPLRKSKAAESPNETIVVAVMGLGRGLDLVNSSVGLKNVRVGYLCDIDDERIARGAKAISGKQEHAPKVTKDIRQALDDKDIDGVMIAAPNHWHAPAGILACMAGKHVYVEKPSSHNPWEGEMFVKAANKYQRVVQMGNQRRSWPALIEAIERLRAGAIGRVLYARCWYNNSRGSIGRGKQVPVPANLDYALWQGPAPERPYKDNLVHYNWHWHWHWGNGELGNNGIHALDVARWGLGVDYPLRVTCNGGRYHYNDDQETPDTSIASYDFGTTGASWDGSSCNPRGGEGLAFVTFYGENGILENSGAGYRILDPKGKEISKGSGNGGEAIHIENWMDSIRNKKKANSTIEDAEKSVLLCHLGNIAYRVGRTIHFDPVKKQIKNDKEAMKHWKREYRAGWESRLTV